MITRANCKDIVKQIRKLNSISAQDFGETLGMSTSTVVRVEAGGKPSFDFMARLHSLAIIGHCRFKTNPKLQVTPETIIDGMTALAFGKLADNTTLIAKVPEVVGICGYGFVKNFKELADANNIAIKFFEGNYELYMN